MTALTTIKAGSSIILVIAAHILLITLLVGVLREQSLSWPARVGLVIVFIAVLVLFDSTLLLRIWGDR